MVKKEQENLYKKLRPVTLYLSDLQEIEEQLKDLTIQGQVFYKKNQDNESKQLIRMVKRDLDAAQITKVDVLKIDYGKYKVYFEKNKTIIQFDDLGRNSKVTFSGVIEYLKPKQRLFPFLRQKINFTDTPNENFFSKNVKYFEVVGAVAAVLGVIFWLIDHFSK